MKLTVADLEVESTPRPEPFEVEAPNGKTYTLPDPRDLSADVLLDLDSMTAAKALSHIIGDDAREFLAQYKLPQVNVIFQAYSKHYALDKLGNPAASPRS